jgi:hypothetical protein
MIAVSPCVATRFSISHRSAEQTHTVIPRIYTLYDCWPDKIVRPATSIDAIRQAPTNVLRADALSAEPLPRGGKKRRFDVGLTSLGVSCSAAPGACGRAARRTPHLSSTRLRAA